VPYQFNSIHILPQNKIPVAKLPIDILISSAVSFARKLERMEVREAEQFTNPSSHEEATRMQIDKLAKA